MISTKQFLVALTLLFPTAALFADDQSAPVHFGRTNPNAGLFPDSSIVDFSYLQDKPAGKHGFLATSPEGKFVWKNGRRARFWGVNISNKSLWVGKNVIDRVVDTLAHSGANMVRFEAIDSTGGLLDSTDPNSSRTIDKQKLETLDYWVYRLKERGIYYYLDLIDFRVFKSEDGVPEFDKLGRAAKPYAFFDRHLIELQKEYANNLLTHKNSFTGLRYVDDPGLALLEICNEHGLFFKAEVLDTLAEPYGAELRQLWNKWLKEKYITREGLSAAWGRISETTVLGASEDPASYSVNLPQFSPAPPPDPALANLVVDLRRAPSRIKDGVRFLYEVQRAYFLEMKTALREIGLKIPITGVVSGEIPPDVASVAHELDFTSENYYADHPTFAGKEWEGEYFYNDQNPLRNNSPYQVAPWLSALRWDNKPVVIREWDTVWPNRYRAISIPEMAAYCCFQDFDAVLLFGYSVTKDPEKVVDFTHQCDPPSWGLFALGAQAYLRGDIKTSPTTVSIQHSDDTLYQWPNGITNLYRLAWFVRLRSTFGNPSEEDLKSPKAKRGEQLKSENKNSAPMKVNISPTDPTIVGNVLDQLHNVGVPVFGRMLETGVMSTCTGEIVRNSATGCMTINTPKFISIAGELPLNRAIILGSLTFYTRTPLGAIVVLSLDGKPLKSSEKYIVKMVSRAENTDQELEAAPSNAPGRFRVKNWGKSPVLTFGGTEGLTIVRINEIPVLSHTQTDGTWELLVNNGKATFVTDTSNVRGTLYGDSFKTIAFSPIVTGARTLAPIKPPAPPKPKITLGKTRSKLHRKLTRKERQKLSRKHHSTSLSKKKSRRHKRNSND